MRELQTNSNVAFCLPLETVLIESVQVRFDKALTNTEYQATMALHPHFRYSLMSDADNQFYQFTSESNREIIKTTMIGLVESLLNDEDLRATSSSHGTEKADNCLV